MKSFGQKSIFTALLFSLCLGGFSCRKTLEIELPRNELTTEQVFADSASATAAILGLYIQFNKPVSFSFANGGISQLTGLASDELVVNNGNDQLQAYQNNSIAAQNYVNSEFWKDAYRIIYSANACIEGIDLSAGLTPTLKRQLTAEARFVRAYIHFYLTEIYGNVPLILTADFHQTSIAPGTQQSVIFEMLTNELIAIKQDLGDAYVQPNKFRPNRSAASALLARIYLYQGNWEKALEQSDSILANGQYALEGDLNAVFLPESVEAIWQLPPMFAGYETTEGFNFVPFSTEAIPSYSIQPDLLNAFDSDDHRKSSWFGTNTVDGVDYFYPFKYKLNYSGAPEPLENYTILRLGELYLIRAEALLETNSPAAAVEAINFIRERAGLADFTLSDPTAIRAEIYLQRRLELCFESGHRFLDLKRTRLADQVLGALKGNAWQTTDQLFPIPLTEIQLNPSLIQNAGY